MKPGTNKLRRRHYRKARNNHRERSRRAWFAFLNAPLVWRSFVFSYEIPAHLRRPPRPVETLTDTQLAIAHRVLTSVLSKPTT